jgi:hypothetical protein
VIHDNEDVYEGEWLEGKAPEEDSTKTQRAAGMKESGKKIIDMANEPN